MPRGSRKSIGHALLVGVERGEDRPSLPEAILRLRHAADQPGSVGTGGRFEVDHLCAQERQQVARERTRPEGRHVQDPRALRTGARRRPVAVRCGAGRVRWTTASMECSPSRGAGSGGRSRACTEPERWSRVRRAIPWVLDERLPFPEVLERGDVGAVGDRCVRDPEGRRQIEDLLDGVVRDPCRRSSAPAPCGRERASGPPSTPDARPWRRSRATVARSRTRVRRAHRWPPRPPASARIAFDASAVRAGRGRSPDST